LILRSKDNVDFVSKFAAPTLAGLPKYAQLREMLIAAITSGYWKPGDRMPTEAQLARSTPYSLGTVQKALRALVDEGLVTRSQGSGTFVTEPRQPIDAPLHLRFLGGKGEPQFLPLFPKVLSRRRISERGPWSDWLQQKNGDIICIDRKLSVNGEFTLFNRFYFNAGSFPEIAKKPLSALDGANLKQLLGSSFNTPITNVQQRISLVRFTPEICKAIGVKAGTSGMLLESAGSAGRGMPIYFLESFIPPNRRKLDIS
jgi:GntR family transcriptional regulator